MRAGAGAGAAAATRAAERAVSGRRAPGIGTTTGERPRSHASVSSASTRPARFGPAQRRVREQCDPELLAALDEPAAESSVVERRERDLHGRDGRVRERLVELGPVDVREARFGFTRPSSSESCKRPHGRAPRRPRVGRVQEVEVDRQAVERREARLAVGADRLRAAVRHPGAAGTRHAALGHDPRGGVRAAAAERASHHLLVVLVCARRVEDGDPRLGCGCDRLGRRLRRQPHAAEADPQLSRLEPGGGHADGCRSGTDPCQPERRTSTRDGGVISTASPPVRGRRSA